jgi:Domain of unknown function (DUF4145)
MDDHVDLSTFADFSHAVRALHPATAFGRQRSAIQADGLFCVHCGGRRRMQIQRLYWGESHSPVVRDVTTDPVFEGPALFEMTCVQCLLTHTAVVHKGADGFEMAVFCADRGGFTTPHTPPEVAYYLDQAHRAESVGALSAAAGMYRSALEMLLQEQGYDARMLGPKIKQLTEDPDPPTWLAQIDSAYLGALNKIGNGAMHANDGDIEKQKVLDRELLRLLRAVFEELLDRVYERPAAEAARKARLLATGDSFTRTSTGDPAASPVSPPTSATAAASSVPVSPAASPPPASAPPTIAR